MIHNHSSGKHRLLKKILAVCMVFAMICSVSISAFSVDANSEDTDEAMQSVMVEESDEQTVSEPETGNGQASDEEQPEVMLPEENTENPDSDNADLIPSEDNEQPTDPTVTGQPEEPTVAPGQDSDNVDPTPSEDNEQPMDPTVTGQPEEPTVTPEQDADASVTPSQEDAQDSDVLALDGNARWTSWPTPTPTPVKDYSGDAAIYYLANPAGDPWTNDTGAWAPAQNSSETLCKINTTDATWENGYVGDTVYKNKNIKTNVASYITSWPDGSTGATWTVKRGDTNTNKYFTFILNSIWENYKASISKDTGISQNELKQEDILEITVTPRKISRDNGGKYEYHVDCALSIKSKQAFTAKFWVKEPGSSEYTQIDAKNYKTGDRVDETIKVTPDSTTKVVNGVTYVLEGWYPESDPEGNSSESKILNWPYSPNDTELADGTVNFYAHYTPLYTSVSIKKLVTGSMGDRSKEFHFTVTVKNGNTELKFKKDNQSCTGTADFSLSNNQTITLTEVPVGATVTVTEDNYKESRYTTSWTVDGDAAGNNSADGAATATISNIQKKDDGSAHEVVFTNNKEAIPDTGLNLETGSYVLALGIAVAGAVLLIFGRRKRQS